MLYYRYIKKIIIWYYFHKTVFGDENLQFVCLTFLTNQTAWKSVANSDLLSDRLYALGGTASLDQYGDSVDASLNEPLMYKENWTQYVGTVHSFGRCSVAYEAKKSLICRQKIIQIFPICFCIVWPIEQAPAKFTTATNFHWRDYA